MPDKKKILLFANGTSGTNSAVNDLFEMIRLLSKQNCVVTVYPIIPDDGLVCENVLDHLNDHYDVIACCGGDGTLNHVMSQVIQNNISVPIGYIPAGSTNDFSRSINNGRALSLEEQCQAIAKGTPFAYDVGKINDEYFNYIAAFGAFTRVSYDTSQKWKNTLGYAAYTLNAIASIPEGLAYHTHVKYVHDGVTDEGDYIFSMNRYLAILIWLLVEHLASGIVFRNGIEHKLQIVIREAGVLLTFEMFADINFFTRIIHFVLLQKIVNPSHVFTIGLLCLPLPLMPVQHQRF